MESSRPSVTRGGRFEELRASKPGRRAAAFPLSVAILRFVAARLTGCRSACRVAFLGTRPAAKYPVCLRGSFWLADCWLYTDTAVDCHRRGAHGPDSCDLAYRHR